MNDPARGGRKEYDFATRSLAEQMYIYQGHTYAEISRDLGISENQLQNWGKAGDWRDKRDQYVNSKAQKLARLIGIQERLLDSMEAEIQPAVIHQQLSGYRQLDAIIEARAGGSGADKAALFIEFLGQIVRFLVARDPEAAEVLNRHFDSMIEHFKTKLG